MIDFNLIEGHLGITKDFILSKLSDEQIFYRYFGSFSYGKAYPSVLRPDNNPSISFYISDSGRVIYHDHALGKGYDCFDFVMERYKCSFQDSLKLIANDFGIINDPRINIPMTTGERNSSARFDRKSKGEKAFQFTILDWEQRHLDYWKDYHFTEEELRNDKFLYPIGELFINKNRIYNPENLLWFVYVIRDCSNPFDNSKVFFKTYMPHSEELKWLTNNPNSNPYGYLDLPYETSTLIITKSRKDMKVMRKIWPDVMATQNESEGSLPYSMLANLKKRYERIFIWFDADKPGVENCTKFNRFGCGYINTPKELLEKNIKDPSDYAKAYGLDKLKDYTFSKLKLWKQSQTKEKQS